MKSMKQEKQQEIALMRYGAIAPIIAGLDERYPSKTAFYMELSTKGLVGPDGRVHHYAPSTIEKWYLDYQNHGFDALIPKGRSDAGMSRKLDDELQERHRVQHRAGGIPTRPCFIPRFPDRPLFQPHADALKPGHAHHLPPQAHA